jgi:hypothetical protein
LPECSSFIGFLLPCRVVNSRAGVGWAVGRPAPLGQEHEDQDGREQRDLGVEPGRRAGRHGGQRGDGPARPEGGRPLPQQPPHRRVAGQEQGGADGEHPGRRQPAAAVLDRRLHAGGHGHQAEQDRDVPVEQRLQGQRRAPLAGGLRQGRLGALLVGPAEDDPPQGGGQGEAQDRAGYQPGGNAAGLAGGSGADGRDRLAEGDDQQGAVPFRQVGRIQGEQAPGVHDQRRAQLDNQCGHPQRVAGGAAHGAGHRHEQGRGDVERRDPEDVGVDPVVQEGVHQHDDQVAEAEHHPVGAEAVRDRQPDDQEARHPD